MLSQIVEAERRGAAALFALLVKPGLPLPEHDLRIACLNSYRRSRITSRNSTRAPAPPRR